MARAIRGVLHARGPARRVSPVSARVAERQPPQVDERDVGARPRSGYLSSVPAFHHRCAVVGRHRVAPFARDHSRSHGYPHSRRHELPEAGATLRRRGTTILRGARQDRELPDRGHRRVVDRGPGVDAGRDVVSPRGVADADAADARPHSGGRPGAAQVAARADVAAAGPRQWDHRDGGAGRRRIWRKCDAATDPAPGTLAVRLGRLVHADDLRRHAGPARTSGARTHRSSTLAPDAGARRVGHRSPRLGRGPTRTGVARGLVAQRHAGRGGPGSVPHG